MNAPRQLLRSRRATKRSARSRAYQASAKFRGSDKTPGDVARYSTTHFKAAERLGLIGCVDGPPDLAKSRRKYIRQAVRAKHRPPRSG